MLSLTRNIGESIIINGNIRILISDVKRGQVRIGIEAPLNISIDREEIHEKKKKALEKLAQECAEWQE